METLLWLQLTSTEAGRTLLPLQITTDVSPNSKYNRFLRWLGENAGRVRQSLDNPEDNEAWGREIVRQVSEGAI